MPMENYDDYELQNAKLAAMSSRRMPMPVEEDMSYDDYELGNAQEAGRSARSIADMARAGRGSDSMVAHVTPGDVVIPKYIAQKDPAILARLKKNFEDEGRDYRDHIVGNEMNSINPETGQPEFGWFKKIFRSVAPILGGIAGGALGGPWGAAAGSALGSKVSGGSNTQALLSGAGAGLGSAFLGSGTGDVAGNLTTNSTTRPLGELLAGTSIGGLSQNAVTGMLAGNSIAGLASGAIEPVKIADEGSIQNPLANLPANQEKLDIGRPDEMSLPGTLSSLGGLDSTQRTTNIATQGTEGGGVSDEGRDYFLNQVRRRLTDTNPGQVAPVEQNYLTRLGVGYKPGNTRSILEGIARYQQA